MEGWYYLHTNGSLIYKRELGGTAADLRESDFVRAMWPLTCDRESAWRILVESLSFGADKARVVELAAKWGCDDADADQYAKVVGCVLELDGDQWCAHRQDFEDLQSSPAGFGPTCLEAMAHLCKELDLKPSKMWGASFKDVLAIQGGAS